MEKKNEVIACNVLFTKVATGRESCGGKKSCSGGCWESNPEQAAREKVSQRKTKLVCCQGVQHGKRRHAQQRGFTGLCSRGALSAGRQNKKHRASPESTHANAEEFWPAWSRGPFKLVTYYVLIKHPWFWSLGYGPRIISFRKASFLCS